MNSPVLHLGIALVSVSVASAVLGQIPGDYRGKPFADAVHKSGPANIPGIVQCALFDLGGEGELNLAEIGTLHFPEAGPQLLTFHYGKGNNFAYFEFEAVEPKTTTKP